MPPELIGFEALSNADLAFVREVYPAFDTKVSEALSRCDVDGPNVTPELRSALLAAGYDWRPDAEHLATVRRIREALERSESALLPDLVLRAALLRRFLG